MAERYKSPKDEEGSHANISVWPDDTYFVLVGVCEGGEFYQAGMSREEARGLRDFLNKHVPD